MRRFGDEVVLHSQQRHPNIVQLIGVYYPPRSQLPMLVMEYLPLSLTQCLEREELPLQMKYSILVDVAKGLCYLHGKRPPIVHRDLTANNVLLTSSYSAKISDLGVSRLANTFKKHTLTTAPGNAMVMPPEALEDNPEYDHKLDVFSYGCLILHVLTGQFPEPTNQFVPEPGKEKSFARVSEWDRRLKYIRQVPKKYELLPLAKFCLTDSPIYRPEMSDCCQFVEPILSKYPKSKTTIELTKEKEAAVKRIFELDAENMVLQAEKKEKDKLEKRLIGDYERLTGNYERLTGDLRQMSSQVTGLKNALSLKEKEFNDCTQVLKETIRSRDEQLVKQQRSNVELLKEREADLKNKHSTKLSEAKKNFESKLDEYESKLLRMEREYEAKLSRMKEEYDVKILATTENCEEQLSISREECEIKVAEVMEEFTLKSRQALEIENVIVSKNEILSSFQSLPVASIPSYTAQNEMIETYYLSQRENMKKGDRWSVQII